MITRYSQLRDTGESPQEVIETDVYVIYLN